MGICSDIEKVEEYGYLFDLPETVAVCAFCGQEILAGQKAYRIGHKIYCADCVEEMEVE
nr:MAG TPA: protein of unknown function (DUF4428) [Caudoviricetes sp.]